VAPYLQLDFQEDHWAKFLLAHPFCPNWYSS